MTGEGRSRLRSTLGTEQGRTIDAKSPPLPFSPREKICCCSLALSLALLLAHAPRPHDGVSDCNVTGDAGEIFKPRTRGFGSLTFRKDINDLCQ